MIRVAQPVLEEWREDGCYRWALYTWGCDGPPFAQNTARTWHGHRKALRRWLRGYFSRYYIEQLPYTNGGPRG